MVRIEITHRIKINTKSLSIRTKIADTIFSIIRIILKIYINSLLQKRRKRRRTILARKEPILEVSNHSTMRTRNCLVNFGPRRNKTKYSLRVGFIERTRTTNSNHITLSRTFLVIDLPSLRISIKRLDTQRLETYIILGRNIKIIKTKPAKRRVEATIINRVRHEGSHNEERTILAERETTLFKTVTAGHLTSERTKRGVRRIEASCLIDDIRTQKTTVGTEEDRASNILNTTDIKLSLDIVRVARTTSHSKFEIPLNV